MLKARNLILTGSLFLLSCGIPLFAGAQNQFSVDYAGQPAIDSDLDGLTDEGEKRVFQTDPARPDSDGDNYLDGAEVLSGSGALDSKSTPISVQAADSGVAAPVQETPWPWYFARTAGLVAFALLYVSIFLGLVIKINFLHKFLTPLYALNAHGWIALQATILALVHGLALTLDKFIGLSLANVLLPLSSPYEPFLVGLGTFGFYLMLILVVTSYARKYISHTLWRTLHFLNVGLYLGVVSHAAYLGTDLRGGWGRGIFIVANIFLVLLMLLNMFLRVKDNLKRKRLIKTDSQEPIIR